MANCVNILKVGSFTSLYSTNDKDIFSSVLANSGHRQWWHRTDVTEKLLIWKLIHFLKKVKQSTNATVCGARGYWPCKQLDNISIE